jgi:amidase
MDNGNLTSSELVAYYQKRIDTLDRCGPGLHAVLQLNPDAASIAAALDAERTGGTIRGRLHGIPVLLKGNINTADSMTTTAGSLALSGFRPGRDAVLVTKLRRAGAVILGKTNLSEWANFRSPHSSSGWSSEGGQTRNPYALDRNPSGSSSGSAVAVSANLCAVAVGTETDGSIISPASANGIVGFKPTVGLVGTEGIIPISVSQDTAGPMARTVADAVILLAAMSDAPQMPGEWLHSGLNLDFLSAADQGLQGMRIGYAPLLEGFLPSVDGIMQTARRVLEALGATLVETELRMTPELGEAELEVMLFEFRQGLENYLQRYSPNGRIKTLGEVIQFNRDNAHAVLAHFGQELLIRASLKGGLDDPAYARAKKSCMSHSREHGIDRAMTGHGLAAIMGPSGGPAWKTDSILGDHFIGGSSSLPAIAGYPNITVPAGFVRGLPVGVSFFGSAHSETMLLRIALAFERATKTRRKPGFASSVD